MRRRIIDLLHYGQNIEKRSNGKINYHSIEEHPKISKISKFGHEMLQNEENKFCEFCTLLYYARKIDTVFSMLVSIFRA